jgi:hypothetical protein
MHQLKSSVYVVQAPSLGLYFALRGERPRLAPLHLATLAPDTPDGLIELALLAQEKLDGIPHEVVRVDA